MGDTPGRASFDPRSWDQRIGDNDAGAFADAIGKEFDSFDYGALDGPAEKLCEELPDAQLTPKQATVILRWHSEQMEAEVHRSRSVAMARVCARLIASKNVPLDIRALALATGIGEAVALESAAEVARELNVTRAAVSKAANKWSDSLGYRVTKYLRPETVRRHCAEAQKQDHWRNRL